MKIPKSDEIDSILRAKAAADRALSVPVMIGHGEVLKVIIKDLVSKYRHNMERGDLKWMTVFRAVLGYYLSQDEVESLIGPEPETGRNYHHVKE